MHISEAEKRRIAEILRAEGCPGAAQLLYLILTAADGYGRAPVRTGPEIADILGCQPQHARRTLMLLRKAGLIETADVEGRRVHRRGRKLYEWDYMRQRSQHAAEADAVPDGADTPTRTERPPADRQAMQAVSRAGIRSLAPMAPLRLLPWHRYPRREVPFAARQEPPLDDYDSAFWATVDQYVESGLFEVVERDGVKCWREGPALQFVEYPNDHPAAKPAPPPERLAR